MTSESWLKLAELAVTITMAATGAIFGGRIAVRRALDQFRQQQAFEKRLAWFERMLAATEYLAQRFEIARTFQSENAEAVFLTKLWRKVQEAHVDYSTAASGGRLFATASGFACVERMTAIVDDAAYETDAFDPKVMMKELKKFHDLPDQLRTAARPLANDVRVHLGLDSLPNQIEQKSHET